MSKRKRLRWLYRLVGLGCLVGDHPVDACIEDAFTVTCQLCQTRWNKREAEPMSTPDWNARGRALLSSIRLAEQQSASIVPILAAALAAAYQQGREDGGKPLQRMTRPDVSVGGGLMANDLASLLTAVEEAWIVLDERVVPDLHENRVGRAIDAIELVARDLRAAAVQTKAAAHQHAEALREFLTDGVFDDWGNPQELDRVRAAADFLDGGQQYAAAGRINCRFFGNEDGPQ